MLVLSECGKSRGKQLVENTGQKIISDKYSVNVVIVLCNEV